MRVPAVCGRLLPHLAGCIFQKPAAAIDFSSALVLYVHAIRALEVVSKVASRIFRTGQPLMRNPPGPRPITITARVSQTAAVAALALLMLGLLGAEAGLRVNASQSIPLGHLPGH